MTEDNDHKKFMDWFHDPKNEIYLMEGEDGLYHKVKSVEVGKETENGTELKAILEPEPFTTEAQTKVCPLCGATGWHETNNGMTMSPCPNESCNIIK